MPAQAAVDDLEKACQYAVVARKLFAKEAATKMADLPGSQISGSDAYKVIERHWNVAGPDLGGLASEARSLIWCTSCGRPASLTGLRFDVKRCCLGVARLGVQIAQPMFAAILWSPSHPCTSPRDAMCAAATG